MAEVMAEKLLRRFGKVLEDPAGYIRRIKSQRKVKVIGWLLTDVPEELIHAAGAIPFCVTGTREAASRADAHLQNWACSMARSCLGMGVQGRLNFLDGLIIPHICDTTRNLGGIWKHVRPLPMMENYLLPRQVDRPSARQYLAGELGRLKAKLEQCSRGEITAGKLAASIALYNRSRGLLRQLFAEHVSKPGIIGNRAVYDVIRASMYMPREDHTALLEDLLSELAREKADHEPESRVRVVISGKVWEPPEVMDILDEGGAVVVADDLATGHRCFADDVPEEGDPIDALAQRQIGRIPFACYGTGRLDRRDFLIDLARKGGASGLIFIHLKYCEPENFDYPDLRIACEAAGIPTLKLETEIGSSALGQLETRIQAFLEMIRGGE